jgi:Holliday junction resolvase-like predicted endonuclease
VKAKEDARFGDPLEMVSDQKMRRIRRAAEAWLSSHPEHGGCETRFDVAAERNRRMELVPRAF